MKARESRYSNAEIIKLLEGAEKTSQLPQTKPSQEPPVPVPVLPRNWTVVTDREKNKPDYQNAEAKEDKVSNPPRYPLQQISTHPNVTFYDEPQEKQFTSSGGHADYNNGVEVTIPPNTIPPGSTVGIKVQPSLAPKDVFAMPQDIESASPAYLITNDGVDLNGEVTLTVEHHLDIKTKEEADELTFLEADSSPNKSGSKDIYKYQQVPKSRSTFLPGEKTGRLTTSLKHFNKFIKVGVKKLAQGLKPRDRNLYTVRVYRSPPQTTGDRIAIVGVSLQGRLYEKFLQVLDTKIPQDYPSVSSQTVHRTVLKSLRFEEMCATLKILSVRGWSVDQDKKTISKSEVKQPETENFLPEELHDYPPRIVCRFSPGENAPKKTNCTLSFAGFERKVEVDIPLEAPQVKTTVDTRKLQEAADKLKRTVDELKDERLKYTGESVLLQMKRMTAALQSSSLLSFLAYHADSIKVEVQIVQKVSECIAKECRRQTMKDKIGKTLSEIETLSEQLSQVTKVKLKDLNDPVEQAVALVELVGTAAKLTRSVDCLLNVTKTFSDINSRSVGDALDCEIENQDFYKVAEFLDNIDDLMMQLQLKAGEQIDVKQHAQVHGTQSAMSLVLNKWHGRNPFAATFGALVDILVDMEKYDVAIKVCEYCVGQ